MGLGWWLQVMMDVHDVDLDLDLDGSCVEQGEDVIM